MTHTILLTRPLRSSQRLATLWAEHGHDSIIDPLLSLEPVDQPIPCGSAQAVIITSANVFEVLDHKTSGLARLLSLPCFCVGMASGERAKGFGFVDVRCGPSDGAALSDIIAQSLSAQNGALIHLAGEIIEDTFEAKLQKSGFEVLRWIVYRAVAHSSFSPQTIEFLRAKKIAAIPVFSPRSAEILVTLLKTNELLEECRTCVAVGLSQAVADVLQTVPWRRLRIASAPNEQDVLTCLQTELAMVQTDPLLSQELATPPKKKHFFRLVVILLALFFAGALIAAHTPIFTPASAPATAIVDQGVDHRVAALEQQVADLQTQLSQARDNRPLAAADAPTSETPPPLNDRPQPNETQLSRKLLATTLLFIELRDAAHRGKTFEQQLAAFQAAASGNTALADQATKLSPFASLQIPTFGDLKNELILREGSIDFADENTDQPLVEHLRKVLKPLISVHPLHDMRFANLEAALAKDDAPSTLKAFGALPEEIQISLGAWKTKLDLRLSLEDDLAQLNTLLLATTTSEAP